MLFSLFIENVIAIKQQVYVFVLCHLHTVTIDCDTQLLLPHSAPSASISSGVLSEIMAMVEAFRATLRCRQAYL